MPTALTHPENSERRNTVYTGTPSIVRVVALPRSAPLSRILMRLADAGFPTAAAWLIERATTLY